MREASGRRWLWVADDKTQRAAGWETGIDLGTEQQSRGSGGQRQFRDTGRKVGLFATRLPWRGDVLRGEDAVCSVMAGDGWRWAEVLAVDCWKHCEGSETDREASLLLLRVLRTGNESHPQDPYRARRRKDGRAGLGGGEGGLVLGRFTASE